MLSDPHFGGTRALVIDGNPATRRAMLLQLRELGVGQVRQSKGLADARFALEQLDVDFVLCADVIEGSEITGQQLLEELRRGAVLPYVTVFVMIATEATYLKVVEAAEAALDCFLLRPYRLSELAERLRAARRRKRELAPIFGAIALQDWPTAIDRCLQRYASQQPYGLHCARLAAELHLKAGQTGDALSLFQTLESATKTPWARLGVARAQLAGGDTGAARKQAEQLIKHHPMMAEAYDVLARVQVDQGELKAALQTTHSAAEITPGCMLRLQHCGSLAFYLDDRPLAIEMLDRAVGLGPRSRLFDALTLMLLALLRCDNSDLRRVTLMHSALKQYQSWHPDSRRLQRLVTGARAMKALAAGQLDEAQEAVLALADTALDDDFDLEAGNLVLAMWVRLPERDVGAGLQDRLVRHIAGRFAVSKVITELMLACCRQHAVIGPLIRSCQAEITNIAEDAMRLALQDQPQQAVELLLAQGASSRNARLIELAGLMLHRHRARLPAFDRLLAEATALHQRCCRPVTHIAGMRRSGRTPGGLLLRGQAFGPVADVNPMERQAQLAASAEAAEAAAAAAARAPGLPDAAAEAEALLRTGSTAAAATPRAGQQVDETA